MKSRLKGFLLFSSIIYPSNYQKNLKADRVPQTCFLFFWLKSKTYTFTVLPPRILQNTVNNWETLLPLWKTIKIACGFQQFCNFPFPASKITQIWFTCYLPCFTCKTNHFLMPVAFQDDSSKHVRCQSLRDLELWTWKYVNLTCHMFSVATTF